MHRIRFGRLGFIIVRFVVSLGLAAALVPAVDTRLAPPPTVWAAGYTVNAVTDPGDGTCDGTCTLRDAILAANASGGADTITFSAGGTILLGAALPAITGPLTIDGSAVSVAVDGANAFRVFTATAPLTLTALTVQHGKAAGNGGGAFFGSSAMVSGTTFISNTATGKGGGAYFEGAATVSDSNFSKNLAGTFDVGGGAYFASTVTVSGSTFTSNSAYAAGGANFVSTAVVTGTTFTSNSTFSAGGANFSSTAVVTGSTFSSNTASVGAGGANFVSDATISAVIFISNTASDSGSGAGGANFGGATTMTGTTFRNNTADYGGGATFFGVATVTGTTFISNTARAIGGGVYVSGVDLRTTTSVFRDNQAAIDGGGIFLALGATADLDNNVIVSNTVPSATGAADISLRDAGAKVTGRHNTFASATPGSGLSVRAGVTSAGATVVLTNTIFDGYAVGVQTGPFAATITLDGVLWSGVTSPTQGAGIAVTNAYTGAAAFVNPAARNYHLATVSAARDVGLTTSLSVDFEGDPRPIGGAPDLGADEYQALPPVAVDDAATTSRNTPVALNVLANDSDPNADVLAVIAVGIPTSGSASISGTTQIVYTPTLDSLGPAVFSYTISDGGLTATAQVTVTTVIAYRLFLPLIRR